MNHADAVIAGAGIIGLSAALELASAGLQVVVFDRGYAMSECSWAAAGMLAAADPENPSALRPLCQLSLRLYPEFLTGIEKLTGRKIPIRTRQTLQGGHAIPSGVEQLSPDLIHSLAPGLQPDSLKFFLLNEQSLDPRDLTVALPEAAKGAGVNLLEQTAVTSVAPQFNSVLIQTARGEWSATNFINACGAWASELAGVTITPRKGQMLLVKTPAQLSIALRTPEVYLVPRDDEHIAIGATVENVGYGKHVDPDVIAALHHAAAELWPPIRNALIVDAWSGLRPASADSLPVIGPATPIDVENAPYESEPNPPVWLALGHFRNGILLAPGTARLLRQMILKERLSIDATAFHPGRFAASIAH